MLYSLGYTVESWIQQKQPVEFDGFGTHGYMLYSLGYTVESWIQQKQPVGVWWIWYTRLHALFTGLYCGVLNPTKAAGGVWWIGYTWLHALFTGLYCGVLNPTKAAGWSLMDLVHMATCSIHWAILWSAESIKIRQNQVVDFDGLGVVRVDTVDLSP